MDRRWISPERGFGGAALIAVGVALLAVLGACGTRSGRRPTGTAAPSSSAPPSSSLRLSPAPAPSASASTSAAPPRASASAAAPPTSAAPARPPPSPGPPGDPCRLTRGPIQLTFTGPAALIPGDAGADARVLFDRDGVPQSVVLPRGVKPAAPVAKGPKAADAGAPKPERLALTDAPERALSPACAPAGASLFCLDKAGGIHRSTLTGEGSEVVAKARPGSPLGAATLGDGHVAYAFLADRKTTEGATTLAFIALDDATPMVLSEDGSGATSVALASRGEDAIAVYLDARRVLTPVHARVISTADGKLRLGNDAVLFVGAGTDGRTPGAIARGGDGHELALLPIEKDEKAFGLAAIRVEEQPRDDSAVTWSLYPGAMDRPAVAATQGIWPIRVLRARPAGADPKGAKVLELGELDAAGAYKDLCAVAEGASFSDLAMIVDGVGALWIVYTDPDGTWLEKRGR